MGRPKIVSSSHFFFHISNPLLMISLLLVHERKSSIFSAQHIQIVSCIRPIRITSSQVICNLSSPFNKVTKKNNNSEVKKEIFCWFQLEIGLCTDNFDNEMLTTNYLYIVDLFIRFSSISDLCRKLNMYVSLYIGFVLIELNANKLDNKKIR